MFCLICLYDQYGKEIVFVGKRVVYSAQQLVLHYS